MKQYIDNKYMSSIYTINFNFQITNYPSFKNIIDRLLENEFKCVVCYEKPKDKSSFYICDTCNVTTFKFFWMKYF